MSTTEKSRKTGPGANQAETQLPQIMTKPLPVILDELESYIRSVEEAVGVAQDAAKESKGAAAQARESGEKAADSAKKAADNAVAKVRDEVQKNHEALITRIVELENDINAIRKALVQEAKALESAFVSLKEKHSKASPWLNDQQ